MNCRWVHYPHAKVAAGILIQQHDHVALVRRAHGPYSGHWSIPGGFIDPGEDPRLAAEREVAEETNLVVEAGRPADVVLSGTSGEIIFLIFLAASVAGELTAGAETAGCAWWRLEGLPDLAFDTRKEDIRRWCREAVATVPQPIDRPDVLGEGHRHR
jgi:8-oxo-dGTP diphosphatase